MGPRGVKTSIMEIPSFFLFVLHPPKADLWTVLGMGDGLVWWFVGQCLILGLNIIFSDVQNWISIRVSPIIFLDLNILEPPKWTLQISKIWNLMISKIWNPRFFWGGLGVLEISTNLILDKIIEIKKHLWGHPVQTEIEMCLNKLTCYLT